MHGLLLLRQPNSSNPQANPSRPVPTELTEEMFTAYCQVVEMMFAVRLSLTQKATARQILQGYFVRGNRKGILSTQTALETYQDLMKRDPVERSYRVRRELPKSLKEMREKPEGQGSEAKWLLGVYHSTYPTVAPGDPPLTRDVANAWIEMDHFLRAQLWGHKVSPITPATRARYDRKMTARWKTFSKEKRYRFIRLPAELIEVKHKWPTLPPQEKTGWQFKILDDPDKRDVLLEAVENPFKKP